MKQLSTSACVFVLSLLLYEIRVRGGGEKDIGSIFNAFTFLAIFTWAVGIIVFLLSFLTIKKSIKSNLPKFLVLLGFNFLIFPTYFLIYYLLNILS